MVQLSDASRHVWLHVNAPRRMLLEVQALLPHDALLAENAKQKRRILSHSLLLLCLGLGLYLWWKERSLLMALFVLRQGLVVMLVWVSDGIVRVSQPLGLATWQLPLEDLISFGVMLTVAVNTLFFRYFMPLFQVSPAGLHMLWWLLALFPLEMLLWAGGRLDLAQAINSFVILMTPLLIAGMVVHKGLFMKTGAGMAAAAGASLPLVWSVPVMVAALSLQVVWALHFLGWMQQDWLPVGRETYIALLNGVLIVLVLLEFSKRSSRSQHETQLRLNLAVEQQRLERGRRQEATDFLAMLTHELKTPLSTIRLALGAPELTPSSRLRADRAVMDMSQVIDRCAQVETLHDEPQNAPEHDGQLLDEIHGLLAHSQEPAAIDLRVDAGAPPCGVDTQLLRIIVSNLLDNALKYRLPQSRVDLTLDRLDLDQHPGLALCVANRPGISGAPDPDKVFHKYYRSSGAHHFTGSGLGLYLAERLARRMGGHLRLEPHATQVRFVLWLPV